MPPPISQTFCAPYAKLNQSSAPRTQENNATSQQQQQHSLLLWRLYGLHVMLCAVVDIIKDDGHASVQKVLRNSSPHTIHPRILLHLSFSVSNI